MPRKSIYVSKADEKIFTIASHHARRHRFSLSQVVAALLAKWNDREEEAQYDRTIGVVNHSRRPLIPHRHAKKVGRR